MDLEELPLDALRTLHIALAVPSGPAAPREQLRAHDVGFHVMASNADRSPIALAAAPERVTGNVITLRFGDPPAR